VSASKTIAVAGLESAKVEISADAYTRRAEVIDVAKFCPTAVDRIDELKRLICAQVPVLIDEARDNITEAINACMEEAQDKDEGKAVLSLAITAKWDLDGSAVVVSMPVNVRRKYEVTALMDDPNQPKLPGIEGEES